jgi:hypothetical protein
MSKKFVVRSFVFVFSAALVFIGSAGRAAAQTPVSETKSEPVKESQGNIKVVFDENAPGVLIVESNGEKVRIDTNKKTVEQIAAVSAEKSDALKTDETAKTENKSTQEKQEKEESSYDFDAGEEPYDYRLINVPTPKKVPKGTWNLAFTHRFTQPIHPIENSARNLFGFDSLGIASFGITYGITDKFYASVYRSPLCQRALCRVIEIGFGYNWISQDKDTPIGLSTYASIEGNGNFTEEYTYNFQAMVSGRIGKRVYLFFSPTLSINSNGQGRFDPRPEQFFPPATVANSFRMPSNTGSFGFGASVLIRPDLLALFEFTPRVGFQLGRVSPIFGTNFSVIGFENTSYPEIGFGIQKNIGKHSFSLIFSNTQTTTTSRYNSSNLLFKPQRLVVGFNLARRF